MVAIKYLERNINSNYLERPEKERFEKVQCKNLCTDLHKIGYIFIMQINVQTSRHEHSSFDWSISPSRSLFQVSVTCFKVLLYASRSPPD